jgi:hypothetical protein
MVKCTIRISNNQTGYIEATCMKYLPVADASREFPSKNIFAQKKQELLLID